MRFSVCAAPRASDAAAECMRPLGFKLRPPSSMRPRAGSPAGAPPLPGTGAPGPDASGGTAAAAGAGTRGAGVFCPGDSFIACGSSAESSGDIVVGAAVLGGGEHLSGGTDLYQFPEVHESGEVRDACGLLQV